MKIHVVAALVLAIACGGDPSGPSVTLPLTSVDGNPVPTTISSQNGVTTIGSGTLTGKADGSCEWDIRTPGGSEISGPQSDCTVKAGVAVALTLTLPGPVFGPSTHTYRFGP